MTLMGGQELIINTGWETTIEIPKRFPMEEDKQPDVATITFKEFPSKGRGSKKAKETMTLADLKKEKFFVMHGEYIIPYKGGKHPKPGSTAKNKTPPAAVHGLFSGPKSSKRRKP